MNPGRLCQIILKSDKEISGYGPLAQHVIFAHHVVRQTPLIALPPLRFPEKDQQKTVVISFHQFETSYRRFVLFISFHNDTICSHERICFGIVFVSHLSVQGKKLDNTQPVRDRGLIFVQKSHPAVA